jgi:hypothetical protein
LVGRAAVRSATSVAHAGRARVAPGGGWVRFVAVQRSWRARRSAAFVRGSGPPSVRFRPSPPGRPWGKPAVSDGRGGAGWRAARGTASQVRCLPPPAWRASTPGRGQQAGARGRRPPNWPLQPTASGARIGRILCRCGCAGRQLNGLPLGGLQALKARRFTSGRIAAVWSFHVRADGEQVCFLHLSSECLFS